MAKPIDFDISHKYLASQLTEDPVSLLLHKLRADPLVL